MGQVVLDASAIVDGLIDEETTEAFARFVTEDELCVPQHCDAEVGSSIRRLLREQGVSLLIARTAVRNLKDLPLQRHPLPPLLERAFGLRENFTFADALYVALAESLDAPLVTRDERLVRAVAAHCPQVVALPL